MRSTPEAENSHKRRASLAPRALTSEARSISEAGVMKPEERPLAPAPQKSRSTNTTRAPAERSRCAHVKPATPPPTTATSAAVLPTRRSGALGGRRLNQWTASFIVERPPPQVSRASAGCSLEPIPELVRSRFCRHPPTDKARRRPRIQGDTPRRRNSSQAVEDGGSCPR